MSRSSAEGASSPSRGSSGSSSSSSRGSASGSGSGKGNAIKISGDCASCNETKISISDRLKIDPAELPPELFRKILSLLPFTSLRSALLVCQRWRTAVECPVLWRKLRLRIREDQLWMLGEVLKTPRLSRLEFCQVLGTYPQPDRWDHAIRGRELAELEESSVTKLLLSNVWVSPGESGCERFASLCGRLSELTLSCTVVDPPAVLSLFQALAENKLLTRLTIDSLVNSNYGYGQFVNLSIVPTDLMVKALARLKELYLCRVGLTEEQLVSLFEVVVGGSFRDVHLSAMDLSQVPAKLFNSLAGAVPRLEFHHARLTDQQVTALLERVVSPETMMAKLKHLDIEYNAVKTVDQELIKLAQLKLENFYYDYDYDDLDEASYFDNQDEEEEDWDGSDEF